MEQRFDDASTAWLVARAWGFPTGDTLLSVVSGTRKAIPDPSNRCAFDGQHSHRSPRKNDARSLLLLYGGRRLRPGAGLRIDFSVSAVLQSSRIRMMRVTPALVVDVRPVRWLRQLYAVRRRRRRATGGEGAPAAAPVKVPANSVAPAPPVTGQAPSAAQQPEKANSPLAAAVPTAPKGPRRRSSDGDCIVVRDADPDYGPPHSRSPSSAEAECNVGHPTYRWNFGDGSPRERNQSHHTVCSGRPTTPHRVITSPGGATASDEVGYHRRRRRGRTARSNAAAEQIGPASGGPGLLLAVALLLFMGSSSTGACASRYRARCASSSRGPERVSTVDVPRKRGPFRCGG